jgi:hypothetical protein
MTNRETQFYFEDLSPPSISTGSGLRPFTLVEAAKAQVRPHEFIRTIEGSPWTRYKGELQLRVGKESFVVAARKVFCPNKGPNSNLVLVKSFSGPDVRRKLRPVQDIKHANIVSTLEIFADQDDFHVVSEYMAMPLSNIAGSTMLSDIRLIAIVAQAR